MELYNWLKLAIYFIAAPKWGFHPDPYPHLVVWVSNPVTKHNVSHREPKKSPLREGIHCVRV